MGKMRACVWWWNTLFGYTNSFIYIHTFVDTQTLPQFEVEKLKVFMDKVRQSLDQQIHFLEKMDKSLLHVLYDVIKLRFKKETES